MHISYDNVVDTNLSNTGVLHYNNLSAKSLGLMQHPTPSCSPLRVQHVSFLLTITLVPRNWSSGMNNVSLCHSAYTLKLIMINNGMLTVY